MARRRSRRTTAVRLARPLTCGGQRCDAGQVVRVPAPQARWLVEIGAAEAVAPRARKTRKKE